MEVAVVEVAQILGIIGAEGEQMVLVVEGFADFQVEDGGDEFVVRKQRACNQQVVIGCEKRELFLKVDLGKGG